VLEDVFGVPFDSVKEFFRDREQLEVVEELGQGLLEVVDNLSPSVFGTVIERDFVGLGDVGFDLSDVGDHDLESESD